MVGTLLSDQGPLNNHFISFIHFRTASKNRPSMQYAVETYLVIRIKGAEFCRMKFNACPSFFSHLALELKAWCVVQETQI
jgi:hypothetical protein